MWKPAVARWRGISPVIGVILLVAIVVLLAFTVSAFASGFGDDLSEPAAIGAFEKEYDPTGEGNDPNSRPYVNVTHQAGEPIRADNILIRDDQGKEVRWSDVWTGNEWVNATEYVHLDGFDSDSDLERICEGRTYTITVVNDDGSTAIVNEWTADEPPNVPPSSALDDNDDGIPNYC